MPTTTKPYYYSDIDLNFGIHPIKQDINKLTDAEAIVASVRNLVLLSKFESPFEPELGSNIRKLLFENWSPAIDALLSQLLAEVIRNHEPRVTLQQIDISFDESENRYNITIYFLIKAIPNQSFSGNFFLDVSR